jgi:hypothetical protein
MIFMKRITTHKHFYVAPHSEIITLNVSSDIMDDYSMITGSKRAKASDSWAKKYKMQPVAPDLGDLNSDNDWNSQTHTPKKSVWDD